MFSRASGRGVDVMTALLCLFSKLPLTLVLFSIFTVPVLAQQIAGQQSVAQREQLLTESQSLITEPISESKLTVLRGNTHRLARPEFDLGTAPATLPMQRMLLVLKRSAEQEAALRKLLDDQQDKASPSYHKWVTPEEFGRRFGPSDSDMQAITAWLQSHGFHVATSKGRTVLEFSGSASQVREAFHTAIHKYVVNEEQHWANANDPQIPAALTPAVAGVLTLHNFLKKPQIRMSKEPRAAKMQAGKSPEVTFSDGTHALGPQDYATIYHSPAFNGGVNGKKPKRPWIQPGPTALLTAPLRTLWSLQAPIRLTELTCLRFTSLKIISQTL